MAQLKYWNGAAWVPAAIGAQGTTGLQGLEGAQGFEGLQGTQGIQGIQGTQGIQGRDGNFGGITVDYTFDTGTAQEDPGTGKVRFNNATISSATEMYLDDLDDASVDVQAFLRTIDDSTSTIKGHFRISNKFDSTDFALFTISATNEEPGYFLVSCAYVSGSASSFTNGEDVIITFARTGDVGSTGAQGIQGIQGIQGPTGILAVQGSINYDTGTSTLSLDEGVAGGLATLSAQGVVPDEQLPDDIVRSSGLETSLGDYILLTEKGGASGVAELDVNARLPLDQAPLNEFDDKTANYTLALTDEGKTISMNVASANTVTVPTDTSVNFLVGSKIDVVQTGAGQTEIVAGTSQSPSTATSWVTRTSNFGSTAIRGLAYGNGVWIVVGSQLNSASSVRRSTDTITWTTQTTVQFISPLTCAAYGNGTWVIAGGSGQLETSTDGITWSSRAANFGGSRIMSVEYGNNIWTAVGYAGRIRTSTDAISWTTQTSNLSSNVALFSVAYGNGIWVAGGYNFSNANSIVMRSTDTITWTTQTSNFGNVRVCSVAYGNGTWAAISEFPGGLRTSTDAITWVTRTSNLESRQGKDISYGNGVWVLGGAYGDLLTSTDTITWTTRTSNFGNTSGDLIASTYYGNNVWVAAGGVVGQIAVSPAVETPVTINSKNNFKKISERYGQAKLVKKGADEWLLTGDLTSASDTTITLNTATTVDTTPLADFTTLEYVVSITQGTKRRSSKVIVQNNGSTVDSSEYGIIETGGAISGIDVDAALSGSDCLLQVTITDASSTNATVKLDKVVV